VAVRKAIAGRDALVAEAGVLELQCVGRQAELEVRRAVEPGPDVVEVKKWDVVRVPPGTWRGYEAGPEGLEILVFGAPNLGENPREDVEGQRDWWAG